jgi:biotin synthase
MHELNSLCDKALAGDGLTAGQLRQVLETTRDDLESLLIWSDKTRRRFFGDRVSLCAIVPGRVGACSEDCRWCAQSAHSRTDVTPSTTTREQIEAAAEQALDHHVARFSIVNSGQGPTDAQFEAVLEAIRALQRTDRATEYCASLGELTQSQAEQLAQAGVKRYHHNLETSRRFFGHLVSTHSFDDRLATLRRARQAGMDLCCGGLLGMGETWDDRIDLALTLRDEVQPASVPLNFLHPIDGTPLGGRDLMSPDEALRCIAIYRLAMPRVDIRIAGGRLVTLRRLQSWIFRAGATGLMVGNYLTTAGGGPDEDIRMIRDLGLELADPLTDSGKRHCADGAVTRES